VSINLDYVADLEAQCEGLREDNEALVRENERLQEELEEAREIGNNLIAENVALKAENERLLKVAGK
jgi:regulator of replication initiation timing